MRCHPYWILFARAQSHLWVTVTRHSPNRRYARANAERNASENLKISMHYLHFGFFVSVMSAHTAFILLINCLWRTEKLWSDFGGYISLESNWAREWEGYWLAPRELPVSVNSFTAAVLIHHFASGNIISHTKRVQLRRMSAEINKAPLCYEGASVNSSSLSNL